MTEKELLDTTGKWDQAIAKNDVDEMLNYMSSDWVIVGGDGITTCHQFIESIRTGVLVHTEMSAEQTRVTVKGTTGLVITKGYSKGMYSGREFSFYEWSTSVFVYSDAMWRCELTMLTPVNS